MGSGSEAEQFGVAGSNGYHLYPGCEVIDNQTAGANPICEPNSVPWAVGDTVEAPHNVAVNVLGSFLDVTQNTPSNGGLSGGTSLSFHGMGTVGGNFVAHSTRNGNPFKLFSPYGGPFAAPDLERVEGYFNNGLVFNNAPGAVIRVYGNADGSKSVMTLFAMLGHSDPAWYDRPYRRRSAGRGVVCHRNRPDRRRNAGHGADDGRRCQWCAGLQRQRRLPGQRTGDRRGYRNRERVRDSARYADRFELPRRAAVNEMPVSKGPLSEVPLTLWKAVLAYDGTEFHGWQVQPGLATVQGRLAEAIRHVTGETVLPQGAGRTDAGVHALGQVATFALVAPIPAQKLHHALNRALPASIRVLSVEPAEAGFHARYSAARKSYEYRIFPRAMADRHGRRLPDRICSPMLARFVWDCGWPLDLAAMQSAAASIVGEHDFTSFAAFDPDLTTRSRLAQESGDQADRPEMRSNIRAIEQSEWSEEAGLLVYRVTGSGFLHHMVRNLVGTFVDVGAGRISPNAMQTILAARDRSAAGPTAPASGLFLVSVDYAAPGGTQTFALYKAVLV